MRYIGESFKRAREEFRDKFNGFLYGVVVGESLARPFKEVPIGGELTHKGEKVECIDRLYSDVGIAHMWPPQAYLVLESCGLLMDMYNRDGTLKQIVHSKWPTEVFSGRAPTHRAFKWFRPEEGFGMPDPKETGLLFRVAPIGVVAGRCKLTEAAAIGLTIRIAELTEKDPLVVFPAVELVLNLMSIFSGESRTPNALQRIGAWVRNGNLKRAPAFEYYKAKRALPLDDLDPRSCLWTWKYLCEAVFEFHPKGKWSEVTSFEIGVLAAVNECPRRETAGALAGAVLGANWRKPRIPFRLVRPVKGDTYLSDISRPFVEETFFTWGGKYYGDPLRGFDKIFKKHGIEVSPEKAEREPERPRPKLFFVNRKKMVGAFWVTAVRNTALQAKYPGGIIEFAVKRHGLSNRHITVLSDMGSDFPNYVDDLTRHGLVYGEDFVVVETARVLMGLPYMPGYDRSPYAIETGVDWLKCEFADKKVQVWFEGGE